MCARRSTRWPTRVLAIVAILCGVLIDLGDTAILDVFTAAVAVVTLAVLIRTKVNSAWLVAAGAVIGVAHAALG